MSKQFEFTKMHGLGNDFIVVSGPFEITQEQIAELCDRHFGIGADGFMIVSELDDEIEMEYWNSDGSEAEMCGNGLRCVARYAVDNHMIEAGSFTVQTPVGPLNASYDGQNANEIDVQVGQVTNLEQTVDLHGYTFQEATVGNPHAISFVESLEDVELTEVGPHVESDPYFPNKTNVEFVQVQEGELHIKIWERGSGQTLACGTGMVSCAVVARDLGHTTLPVTIHVPGGTAKAYIDDQNYTHLVGPAEVSFTGTFEL